MNNRKPTNPSEPEALGPAMTGINEQQRRFVIAKVFGGMSSKDAAQEAGYSASSDDVLKSTGHRLSRDPRVQAAITECTLQLIRTEGAKSVRELVRLRDHGTDERVRLRAAGELLDRCGGLSATSQHQHEVIVKHGFSLVELEARRLQLERELGITPSLPNPNVIEGEFTEVDPDLADLL